MVRGTGRLIHEVCHFIKSVEWWVFGEVQQADGNRAGEWGRITVVIAGDINNGAVTPDHLLRVAGVIGTSTGVVDDKSIVVELILYHVSSELFGYQRCYFALGHHGNALGCQDEHTNGNGSVHLHHTTIVHYNLSSHVINKDYSGLRG